MSTMVIIVTKKSQNYMSNKVIEEFDFEKSIEDFLLEADQLEDSDLDFCKQTIELFKEYCKKIGFDINDEIACYCFIQLIALGFVHNKHGIKNQLSSPEFLTNFKPYLDLVNDKENIVFILKLNPLECREYPRFYIPLFTKMFKKQSWVNRNDINRATYNIIFGNLILNNVVEIEEFIKHAEIKPQDYLKYCVEPLIVSNFFYYSLLSKATNKPQYKDYFLNKAKDELREIHELCDSKTKNLVHPDDARFKNYKERFKTKFVKDKNVKDKQENKSEAEGIFNELISEKFSKNNLMDIVKMGLRPEKNLLSISQKFKDTLRNKIESYWIHRGHTKEKLREARDKYKNINQYSPDDQKQIGEEYDEIFNHHEFSFSQTDSRGDSDPYDLQKEYIVNTEKENIEYVYKNPETTLELLYSNDKFNINEIVDEFTLKQSPALKKVGLFLSDKFHNYINPNTNKFKVSEIQKDSKLPKRSIERFTKSFYKHIKEEYPELNPSN